MDAKINDIKQKKHLGQYFSGSAVASLLAHLASFETANTIIDPMSGTGDMLLACKPSENPSKLYIGVEIDKIVYRRSTDRFKNNNNVKLIKRNIFKLSTIKEISSVQYDLVITNPPYVRYQTISENKQNTPKYLSTFEIKRNLIKSLDYFEHLDLEDKILLKLIISNYSGLSDLAVPSWLLCALLTKIGGRIAMVVPHTWLNREYASIIQYLLFRWFRLEYIIEDGNSEWFPNAQVKTTLLVAKRINRKDSIFSWKLETFKYCTIFSTAMTENSLIGKIVSGKVNPEKSFVKLINRNDSSNGLFNVKKIRIVDFANNVKSKVTYHKWFSVLEPSNQKAKIRTNEIKIPSDLHTWLNEKKPRFQFFHDIGVSISQGLRTGANLFFYLDIIKRKKNGVIAMPSRIFEQKPISIPSLYYKEVVRKQSELELSYSLSDFNAKGIVLNLQKYALSEDIYLFNGDQKAIRKAYNPIPEQLSEYVRTATKNNISKEDEPKYIPNLSAVSSNIKIWHEKKPNELPRFWYMLPSFTKRHSPDLFIPRVNSGNPQTRLNNNGVYIIDANFSSLWVSDNTSQYDNNALIALLNSSWCVVAMEEYGTIMGGGALKLEAIQLKRIPVPVLSSNSILTLSRLGKKLWQRKNGHSKTIEIIDQLILNTLGFNRNLEEKLKSLSLLKYQLLKKRNSS